MPNVIYKGPTNRDDISTEYVIRDADRKPYTLRVGSRTGTEVPDEVAARLLGDDSPKGHKFELYEEPAVAEGENADTPPEADADGAAAAKTTARARRAGQEA